MKVLLINPSNIYNKGEDYFITFPLGIAYLAAYLEKFNHDVIVIDCLVEYHKPKLISKDSYRIGLPNSKIIERIEKIKPDLIGITCGYTAQFQSSKKLAEDIKKHFNIPLVIGGAHSSALPKEVLEDSDFDFAIIGEGEKTLLKLANALERKKDLKSICGLVYKKDKGVFINPKLEYIQELDDIPFPARHLFPMKKYFLSAHSHAYSIKRKPYVNMITSRGCPFNCIFCSIHSVWGFKWRGRDPVKVVDEIEHLCNKYGAKEIHFEDDNFSLDKARVIKICDEIIRRKLDIAWTTPNGVYINNLDEEVLTKMKESGCYRLKIAIESGNQYVLNNLIRKPLSLEKVKKVVKIMKKLKIEISCFFVIGVPGETRETVMQTIELPKKLDVDEVLFSIATPYPGTDMYKLCIDRGYIKGINPMRFKPKYAMINTESLSSKELERLRNLAYIKFLIYRITRHPISFLRNKESYITLNRYSKFFLSAVLSKRLNKIIHAARKEENIYEQK